MAVASAPATTDGPQPPRRGWGKVVLAALLFVLLPAVPILRAITPVEQTLAMLLALVAACALVGWWRGGPAILALVALVIAAAVLSQPAGPPGSAYSLMARGWMVLLAAVFGLVSVLGSAQSFFVRALSAIGVSLAIAFALTTVAPRGVERVRGVMTGEFSRRSGQSVAALRAVSATPAWRDLARRSPSLDSLAEASEAQLLQVPARSATLLPALIALESLAALALAWAIYNRLSLGGLGPPLGALREFRFNDQLVWGLAVGATIFLLPPFAEGRNGGLNLLVFFGALYLLRGLGILSWMARGRAMVAVLIVMTIFAWPLLGALALGVGVGDTWLDWRSRVTAR